MWVTPLFDSIFERLFLLKSGSLIYDFDDAIFLNGTNIKGNIFRKYIKNNNKSKLLIKNSSHVITSSPYNLEYCLNTNKYNAATYIPCSLDESRFVPITNDSRSELSIGWTGTFTSKVYLDSIKHIIQKACIQYDLRLVLITNFDYHIDGIKMQVIRWKEKTEIEDLQKIDIGLYPLIPSDWALGKGGLKTLQYMSIGIPSISTNFGTATKIVTNKENGFLVNNDEEWLDAIENLVNNKSLRDNLGRSAREHVINNYSIDALSKLYLDVLKQELQ
jgi:glycosyltransferase involved in cell wall biosynthesis